MKSEKEIKDKIEEKYQEIREALIEPNYQNASFRDLEIGALKWVLE